MSTEYRGGFFRSRSCGAELGSHKVVRGVKSGDLGRELSGREKVEVHEEKCKSKIVGGCGLGPRLGLRQ